MGSRSSQCHRVFIEVGEGTVDDVISTIRDRWWLRKRTKLGSMLEQAVTAKRFLNAEGSGTLPLPVKKESRKSKLDAEYSDTERSRRRKCLSKTLLGNSENVKVFGGSAGTSKAKEPKDVDTKHNRDGSGSASDEGSTPASTTSALLGLVPVRSC
ncbi:hypothetical protein VKT23_008635 [Stygiomarasmius scandens]|uniref:Uncharacterized protein n=1 Tax=Marasmiellus scandens TaxID=2682957 RepID=A0ABR1JL97_9AGAR